MRFHRQRTTQAGPPPATPATRHTLPPVTPEQRAAALAKSATVRRNRAEVLTLLKTGKVTMGTVLASPYVQRARIGQVVRAIEGVGPVKAAAILAATGIDPARRVSQVGARQREKLLARLETGTSPETEQPA